MIWPHVRDAPSASASSSCGKPPRPGSEARPSPPSARSSARTSSRNGVPWAWVLEAARSALSARPHGRTAASYMGPERRSCSSRQPQEAGAL